MRLYAGEIILGFGFAVMMGCLYGYIFRRYFGGDDTWMFNNQSLEEYQKLVHQPGQFFKDLLPIGAIKGAHGFGQTAEFYIMDLEYWLLPKMLAIFNIVSRGNYYINVVFFNAVVFWGHYWLFKLLATAFPAKRKRLVLIIFFFPPIIFWLSGIRADGILLFFIAWLLAQFNNLLKGKKTALLYCILALLGILIFRNVLVLLLLPALVAWFITVRFSFKPVWTFIITYGITAVLFFGTSLLSNKKNLPGIVVQRQQEYFALKGNTRYKLDSLQPTLGSFVEVFPQSAGNTLIRPFPWEAKGPLQVFYSIDILFFLLLLIACLFKKDKDWKKYFHPPLPWVFLFFALSLYLFIGYTVPFPGAIIRYKVIGELFMLIVFLLRMA